MAKEVAKKVKVKRPTALKRDIQNEKKRNINRSFKSTVRTAVRKLESEIKSGSAETRQEALSSVYSLMDKAIAKGVYKKNKVSRSKARLTAQVVAATGKA
ncbi:MAG: 30S ribosomal protein S20 [Parachlamydiaceae bacterium]|nr:30S ribosomal protein S20 [Parachlamydiaceae bacterium]